MSTPELGHEILRDKGAVNIRTTEDGEFWCVRGDDIECLVARYVVGRAKDDRLVSISLTASELMDGKFKRRWDAAVEALNNYDVHATKCVE